MYGRFVRRVGAGNHNTHTVYAPLVLIASLLFLVVAAASLDNLISYTHVDPLIYKLLSENKCAVAYAVASHPLKLRALRSWVFGDKIVYKLRICSISELEWIARRVNSLYAGNVRIHIAPLYFLDPSSYPFKDIDIDNVFHMATGPWTGRGVTVAVIDTGIDYTHPDFYDANNKTIIKVLVSTIYRINGSPVVWIPYVNGTIDDLFAFDKQAWDRYGEPVFLDINGHGTHVAGIIAGQGWASEGKYRGIAPGARLVVIKAFYKDGTASIDSCLDALEWVYENAEKYNINILSLSWGATMPSNGDDPLSVAVDAIAAKGIWVFAAAGNEGNIPMTVVVPAAAHGAIAVGAWDPYYDRLAPFSSIGPTTDLRLKPDIVAAGVMIVSTKSRFASFPKQYEVGEYYVALSGTSMATPAAAAVAADFIEYYRYWFHKNPTINDFIEWVKTNGRRIDPFTKDFITGWGIPIAPHS